MRKWLYSGYFLFFLLWFTLGTLGPLLSFYSLQEVGFSEGRALLYSAVTFFLDGLNVLFLSGFIQKFLQKDFNYSLKLAVLVYSPLWLFDFFDMRQELRFLSNLGLIFSLYVLYKLTEGKAFLKLSAVHIFLYAINSLTAELIASSPLFSEIVNSIF